MDSADCDAPAPEPGRRIKLLKSPVLWVVLGGIILVDLLALWWLRSGMWEQTGLGAAFWAVVLIPVATVLLVGAMAVSLVRNRFQFGLRTLLIAFTIAGVGLGWIGNYVQWQRQQRDTVAKLVAAGARVEYSGSGRPGLAKLLGRQYFHGVAGVRWYCRRAGKKPDLTLLQGLKGLRRLYLLGAEIDEGDLAALEPLDRLMCLELGGATISRSALAHLDKLAGLTDLGISGSRTRIEVAELAHLVRLTRLRHLSLDGGSFGDEALCHVGRMYNLTELWLTGTKITDAGLLHLRGLTSLKWLLLTDTQIGDAGLEALTALKRLPSLGLAKTQVTDAGMKHLAALKDLNSLDLNDTLVSDAGLEDLKTLRTLRQLYLANTQVTDEGLTKLRKALPDCIIAK